MWPMFLGCILLPFTDISGLEILSSRPVNRRIYRAKKCRIYRAK